MIWPSPSQVIFSRNLQHVLQQRNLSCRELSRRSGVSQSHLDSILHGRVGLTFYVMDRLCSIIKMSPVELLSEKRS